MDFADNGALNTLKWILGQSPGTPPPGLFIQLHVGDPGKDGTANIAGETTRVSATFAAAANTGTDGRAETVTAADVEWTGVSTAETYSHVSIWDAVTAGGCWYKGAMTQPITVAAGSDFVFPAGEKISHS